MQSMEPSIGLFVGAGASCEIGMPLVSELTSALKSWLTPDETRGFNESWRSQGEGYSNAVIDDFVAVLREPQMHYESILGYLETRFHPAAPLRQEYYALYSWLVEVVYYIFYLRHINNVDYIARNLHYLEGIQRLASETSPLWIFSLNHDLLIECLAAHYKIPLNCGFGCGLVKLPKRDKTGAKVGDLTAESLTADQLERGMVFFPPCTPGINLLKIHGSLDTFTFREGQDLLKLVPTESSVSGVITALRSANEELLYVDARVPHPARTINEITYADEVGEMQFLRRSLLAGAFKFDNRFSQVLPFRILDNFKSCIERVSKLVCIGYGFGDAHINGIIRTWLERSTDRQLEIVSPKTEIPSFLLHLTRQITPRDSKATDYIDAATGIVRSRHDALEKSLGAWISGNRDKDDAQRQFLAFIFQTNERTAAAVIQKLSNLPRRDGKLDFDSLGIAPEQLAHRWLEELGLSVDEVLQAFLESRARTF